MSAGTIALLVAYDGSRFSGFARQAGDIATVQGRLEEALQVVLGRSIETVCAGRTDAGVHALGQVVSFDAQGDEPPSAKLARSVTALAGPGIVVRDVLAAPAGFSARFDAESREYRYRIVGGNTPPLFLDRVAWWSKGDLDVDAMREGASHLVGEHDFRSFCVTESAEDRSTVRRIERIEVAKAVELGEECLELTVVGNAFLHSMVRVVAGTLVEVARGRRGSAWVAEALGAGRRAAAGPTAPAHGLTLWLVVYPDGLLVRRT